MTAFLRERAWRLPKTSLVIPNVLPPTPPGQLALKVRSCHLEASLIPAIWALDHADGLIAGNTVNFLYPFDLATKVWSCTAPLPA